MHAPLVHLSANEFSRLATLAGLHVGEDDLLQLDRRGLVRPFGPSAKYGSAHLYVLALYFEAIRVVRHPWATRAPDRKLEDVKVRAGWLDTLLAASQTNYIDEKGAEEAGQLLMELERFLANINPFGSLSTIFNLMHPQVFDGVRGDGKLFVELKAAAESLADVLERAAAAATDDEEDLRSTVAMDLSQSFVRENRPVRPVVNERTTVETSLKPSEIAELKRESDARAQAAANASSKPAAPVTPPVAATPAASSPTDVEATVPAKSVHGNVRDITPEPVVTAPDPQPAQETPAEVTVANQAKPAVDIKPAIESKPANETKPAVETKPAAAARPTPAAKSTPLSLSARVPENRSAPKDDFDDDEDVSQPTQIISTPARPGGVAAAPSPVAAPSTTPSAPVSAAPASASKGFDRESNHTQRTQHLMTRLEELRSSASKITISPGDVASQIEDLNRMREQYLQAQDWTALANLYEEKISLFEDPAERQQIRIALATIYEAKLQQPRKAFESYIFAYETDGPSRQKAMDGVRRTGKTSDVNNSYQAWLENRLAMEVATEERRELQGDLALLLHLKGDSQRAYLMFAAFLAEDPDRHITAESINQLEELSLSVGDDELDNFYQDIIDSGPSARVTEIVALRAGLSFLSQNQAIRAIPMFRKVLEAAPQNEVAFTNLSRLYEAESNWSDLAGLLRKRLTHAPQEARPKLEASLERAYEQEMRADAEAVAKWQLLLESSPDDEQALRRVVFGYQAHGRHMEAYAFLNRLLPQASVDAQKAAILMSLADLATNALGSLEEAQHHLEAALEVGGPTAEVLGGFVDYHMAAENFANAVAAVESLLAVGDTLSKDAKLEWLRVGVEAAEQANLAAEREKFLSEMKVLESTHEA